MNKLVKTFFKLAFLTISVLLVYKLYADIIDRFLDTNTDLLTMLLRSSIVPNILMMVVVYVWMRKKTVSFSSLGFTSVRKEGWKACFYFLPIVALCMIVLATMRGFPSMDLSIWILLIAEVILIAVFEELVFRGIFYRSLKPYGNTIFIGISSILFAIGHMQDLLSISIETEMIKWTTILLLVYLPLSMMFAYLRINSKSILPCIVYHFLHNIIIVNYNFDYLYIVAFFTAYAYAMHVYNKRKERIV